MGHGSGEGSLWYNLYSKISLPSLPFWWTLPYPQLLLPRWSRVTMLTLPIYWPTQTSILLSLMTVSISEILCFRMGSVCIAVLNFYGSIDALLLFLHIFHLLVSFFLSLSSCKTRVMIFLTFDFDLVCRFVRHPLMLAVYTGATKHFRVARSFFLKRLHLRDMA